MPITIDLGGAPANEDCAQLGHTPDFAAVNRLEVDASGSTDDHTIRSATETVSSPSILV